MCKCFVYKPEIMEYSISIIYKQCTAHNTYKQSPTSNGGHSNSILKDRGFVSIASRRTGRVGYITHLENIIHLPFRSCKIQIDALPSSSDAQFPKRGFILLDRIYVMLTC